MKDQTKNKCYKIILILLYTVDINMHAYIRTHTYIYKCKYSGILYICIMSWLITPRLNQTELIQSGTKKQTSRRESVLSGAKWSIHFGIVCYRRSQRPGDLCMLPTPCGSQISPDSVTFNRVETEVVGRLVWYLRGTFLLSRALTQSHTHSFSALI